MHFVVIKLITIRVVDLSRKGELRRLFKQKEFLFSTRMISLQVEEKYRIKGKTQNQGSRMVIELSAEQF